MIISLDRKSDQFGKDQMPYYWMIFILPGIFRKYVDVVTFTGSYVTLSILPKINFYTFIFHFSYERIDAKKNLSAMTVLTRSKY